MRRRFLQLAGLVLLLALLVGVPLGQEQPAQEQEEDDRQPLDVGLTEEAEVSLILLDVQVTDRQGRPRPGLTLENFELQLGPNEWPIVSVDDFCTCEGDGFPADRVLGEGTETLSASGDASRLESSSPVADASVAGPPATDPQPAGTAFVETPASSRFILYFDFSQLQPQGRGRAFQLARSWVTEYMQPDDRAEIAGFGTFTGLQTLCPPTSDRVELLAALDRAESNPELMDLFPARFSDRIGDCLRCIKLCEGHSDSYTKWCGPLPCVDCCPECTANPMRELSHGRRSLNALKQYLAGLQGSPGRKIVILFHENANLFPGRFYPLRPLDQDFIGNHTLLLGEVGAEATSARAVLHAVQLGARDDALADQAATVGANLADFTGGTYNRSFSDQRRIVDSAGRECACLYRLAFRTPNPKDSKVYNAVVRVDGERLPFSFRVQYLTPEDRLMRRSQFVLANPAGSRDLVLAAAVIPVAAGRKSWSVTIQVAVEMDSLPYTPAGDRDGSELDIGALLSRQDGHQSWDMLTRSAVHREGEEKTGFVVVHEREFKNLKAGSYRLVAFARERTLDLFGGAEASIDLPAARQGGVVGPLAMSPGRVIFESTLPLFGQSEDADTRTLRAQLGSIPALARSDLRGRPLAMMTWLCPDKGSDPPQGIVGFITRDGVPLFRLHDAPLEPAGRCFRVAHGIDTSPLEPGAYAYQLLWDPTRRDSGLSASVPFQVMATEAEEAPVPD